MSKPVAIFDIDGTLYRSNLGVELIREVLRKHPPHGARKEDFFAQYNNWLKSKDRDAYFQAHFDPYYEQLLVGTPDQVFKHAAENVIKRVGEQLLDWTLHELERHKDSGKAIILISAAPLLVVEPLAEMLGADFYWGWDLVFEGGMYMGPVQYKVPPLKAKVIGDIMGKNELVYDGSYGYGDDISDAGWLTLVEHATAVNPDGVLEHTALTLGWHVHRAHNLRHYPTEKLIHE